MTTHQWCLKDLSASLLVGRLQDAVFFGGMLPSPLPVAMKVKIDMGIPKHL